MGSTFKSSGKTRMGGVRHCTIRTDRATAPRKIRMVLGAMIRENAAHFKKEKSHEDICHGRPKYFTMTAMILNILYFHKVAPHLSLHRYICYISSSYLHENCPNLTTVCHCAFPRSGMALSLDLEDWLLDLHLSCRSRRHHRRWLPRSPGRARLQLHFARSACESENLMELDTPKKRCVFFTPTTLFRKLYINITKKIVILSL